MISPENLQDMQALNISPLYANIKQEHQELFDKYKIDANNRKVLSVLIDNLNIQYLKEQSKEGLDVSLIREMSVLELLYYYTNFLDFIKIIDVVPMSAPVSLIYYKVKKENHIDLEHETISAMTRKSDGIGHLFNGIQSEISQKLFENIDEPEEINADELKNFLKETDHNHVAYDKSIVLDGNSFKPMISNGAIVRTIEDTKQKKIEVNGFIPKDEILLKKQGSKFDLSLTFCPYMLPIRAMVYNTLKDAVLARFAIFSRDTMNEQYKRVKIKI